MQTVEYYLKKINIGKEFRGVLYRAMMILSLVVVLGVFWELKLTGITMAGEAFCGIDEHSHSEECVPRELICTLEEVEPHVHTEACLEKVLHCTLAEQEGHTHSEECRSTETVYLCGLEEIEAHAHGEECYGSVQTCTLEEQDGHAHTEECGDAESGYLCGLEEVSAHVHGPECCETALVCSLAEQEGHAHSEECGTEEREIPCPLEESEAHFHEDACYAIVDGSIVCGLEETEGHLHEDTCYITESECPLEEHTHISSCYSDLTADLETNADWRNSLADLPETWNQTEYLILVAQSQLGYQESVRNFQVDELDCRRGITRYGQWYGNPYGDWSAMFAGFCLRFSGWEDLPVNAGPEAMRMEWKEAGYYGAAADFDPAAGDLLFLDKDGNGTADAVAIITSISESHYLTIEGDVNDTVAATEYLLDDPAILGYGLLPEEQPLQPGEGTKLIAQTESYSEQLFDTGNCLVVYVTDGIEFYALDGNGELVPVFIDEAGWVYTDLEIPEMLLWNVSATEDGGYVIENAITQMYLPEDNMTVSTFSLEEPESDPEPTPTYQYARAVNYTVWLDGTNGGLMSYGNAQNLSYTVTGGSTFKLPTTWQSGSEYNYVINGWYDVINNKYYKPGDEVTVNRNLVFYADWVAASYNIGQFNSQVANTVSTNEFITTRLFDYNVLFNVLSSSASVNVSSSSHSETWRLITSGNSPYSGESTLNYIFRDWDQGSQDMTYPNGVGEGSAHWPTNAGSVYPGLYTSKIGSLLFNPSVSVIGKTYLGTADHLFQLCKDPSDPNYGYYYYDSELNAASYNQSHQRFYVYDYLEQTTSSATTDGAGKYSDFLPLNSPYANTNGRTPATYSYRGKNGEYAGTTHYMYDATNSSDSNVATNFFFGMSIDIDFYLPNKPGSGANQDVYGKDMHFRFSGDDDVWVFVDGKLVLDLGGIHGIESGDINFSTGVVTVNGAQNNALTNTLRSIDAGEHVLTLYYLERGSSMGNCAIYFNLAPRFSFSIQKEDVLTQDTLNGAQFSVYTDKACTKPAELWVSKASHDRGDTATNVFTVTGGIAEMWGFGAGNTYYIKETKPPDAMDYGRSNGIICVTIDKQGLASYNVELIKDGSTTVSPGFTVHGFRIDEETQKAYIVATNAPVWAQKTTEVWAHKRWSDGQPHTGESVTVYLTITDADGTVRRLQEAQLSSENNWKHSWTNLPKFAKDGVTPIQYGVEEAYVSGYYSKVTQTNTFSVSTTVWQAVSSLEDGKTYILKTSSGCLSTLDGNSDTGFQWVSEEMAKTSSLALWTADVTGNNVKLTNGANQKLTFYYNNGSSGYPTDFFASTGSETNESKQNFRTPSTDGGLRIFYDGADGRDYYLTGSMTDAKKFNYSTNSGDGLVFTPMTKVVTTKTETVGGWGYEITNSQLTEETSLTVTKYWDYGHATDTNLHEQFQVTVALLANGKRTGRTVTLSLKNGWKGTFRGLPYKDDKGNVIAYSVEETWENTDWRATYGEVTVISGKTPSYAATVTNHYKPGMLGPELPSTGSWARMNYMLCGSGIMLCSLVYGFGTRHKRERRKKDAF